MIGTCRRVTCSLAVNEARRHRLRMSATKASSLDADFASFLETSPRIILGSESHSRKCKSDTCPESQKM